MEVYSFIASSHSIVKLYSQYRDKIVCCCCCTQHWKS